MGEEESEGEEGEEAEDRSSLHREGGSSRRAEWEGREDGKETTEGQTGPFGSGFFNKQIR